MIINETAYKKLLDVCGKSECFYYNDKVVDNSYFRLFNYRLAAYSDWMVDPLTFDMRGLMVETTADGEFIRVASRPPNKFFNLNENPFVMNLDLTCSGLACDKLDGSLISTYSYNHQLDLGLKSKMSVDSNQAVDSLRLLKRSGDYFEAVKEIVDDGFTIYFEYCSPTNRVVLGYDTPMLTVLGVRNNISGQEMKKEDFPKLAAYWVNETEIAGLDAFVPTIAGMKGIEGYVIWVPSLGVRFKCKSTEYLALHHTKDSITNPRRLFECVLEETSDDLRTLFATDPLAIKLIEEMEAKVEKLYNHVVSSIDLFYETNKHLTRKDYAILAKEEVDPLWFGLAMNKYIARPFSYKDAIKDKWKVLGFKDEKVIEE